MKRAQSRWLAYGLGLCAVPAFLSAAPAQVVVSANDGKALLVDGVNTVPANPAPDNVAIIDFGASPPKILATVNAPASVVGPPASVAVTPDGSIAIVTASTRLDPADPKKRVAGNQVSVIDLKANPPALVSTIEVAGGAGGIAVTPAGNLALIANRQGGTVSVFKISGKTLTPAGKVDLGSPNSTPSGVAISPDGKTALVTRDGDHRISVLSIDGDKVEYTKRAMQAGIRPNSVDISPRGDVGVNVNIGTGGGDTDTISLIDLAAKPPRVVDTVSTGQTPETVKISPDGAYVAVVLHNGSNKAPTSPFYNDHGLLQIFAIQGKKLVKAAEGRIGSWCQGVLWSKDGRKLMVQCMVGGEIEALSFDGKEIKKTGSVKVSGGPGGFAMVP